MHAQGIFEKFQISQRSLYLESRLKEWACPHSTDTSLRLLAEAYRSSALLYLYRVQRQLFGDDSNELALKAMAQATAAMENIEQMPPRSLPECTLLFPLFIAGGESTTESHIQVIRSKMLDIIESLGFRNVEVALSVWRSCGDCGLHEGPSTHQCGLIGLILCVRMVLNFLCREIFLQLLYCTIIVPSSAPKEDI